MLVTFELLRSLTATDFGTSSRRKGATQNDGQIATSIQYPVRADCHQLITDTKEPILDITSKPPVCQEGSNWYRQMAAFWLPEIDGQVLEQRLYNEFSIEVPVTSIGNEQILRISFQGYNSQSDIEKLVTALRKLLPEVSW